jgi:hypothetical protein
VQKKIDRCIRQRRIIKFTVKLVFREARTLRYLIFNKGNHLGSESLSAFAKLLKTNETIRLIDVEGNKILKTVDDKTSY